jgi:hypothetical protein
MGGAFQPRRLQVKPQRSRLESSAEKTLRLGSADGSHFTALQRRLESPTEVCTETAWTKEQSQRRVWKPAVRMVSNTDRLIIMTDTRPTHHSQERCMLHKRPNTFAQTCLLALSFSLQSDGGPYIFAHLPNSSTNSEVAQRTLRTIRALVTQPIDGHSFRRKLRPRGRLSVPRSRGGWKSSRRIHLTVWRPNHRHLFHSKVIQPSTFGSDTDMNPKSSKIRGPGVRWIPRLLSDGYYCGFVDLVEAGGDGDLRVVHRWRLGLYGENG